MFVIIYYINPEMLNRFFLIEHHYFVHTRNGGSVSSRPSGRGEKGANAHSHRTEVEARGSCSLTLTVN